MYSITFQERPEVQDALPQDVQPEVVDELQRAQVRRRTQPLQDAIPLLKFDCQPSQSRLKRMIIPVKPIPHTTVPCSFI